MSLSKKCFILFLLAMISPAKVIGSGLLKKGSLHIQGAIHDFGIIDEGTLLTLELRLDNTSDEIITPG